METRRNRFKRRLAAGETQYGLWSGMASPIAAEILGASGFDWVVLDCEHAPNDPPGLVAQMQALELGGIEVIARPQWNDPVLIKRLMDLGVQSLVVPYVQNADEARAAVAATRYPPDGVRGVAGGSRAAGYGRRRSYLGEADEEACVIVQAETAEAVDRIEEIAGVEGVDCVFIGPADLAASMGCLGRMQAREVQDKIAEAAERLERAGTPGGILSFDPDEAERYAALGYRFVAVGSDVSALVRGVDDLRRRFKG